MVALVIEDNRDVAYIASFSLQQLGFQTETFFNGNDALTYLKINTPVLILLDLQLPEISGTAIVDYVHQASHLSNTRVIVMTAYENLADQVRDRVDFILMKPVRFRQLRDYLQRFKDLA